MTTQIKKTPLDAYFRQKTGLLPTQENIRAYQLEKINETIAYIRSKSPYYRNKLSGCTDQPLKNPEEITRLPFTTSDELKRFGEQFLCVGQKEIARIVTLATSGTTDLPKRVYYTKEDQELTVSFFYSWDADLCRSRG